MIEENNSNQRFGNQPLFFIWVLIPELFVCSLWSQLSGSTNYGNVFCFFLFKWQRLVVPLAVGRLEQMCPWQLWWHVLNLSEKSQIKHSGAMQNRCCCKHLWVLGYHEPSRVAAYHRAQSGGPSAPNAKQAAVLPGSHEPPAECRTQRAEIRANLPCLWFLY